MYTHTPVEKKGEGTIRVGWIGFSPPLFKGGLIFLILSFKGNFLFLSKNKGGLLFKGKGIFYFEYFRGNLNNNKGEKQCYYSVIYLLP